MNDQYARECRKADDEGVGGSTGNGDSGYGLC